MTQDVRLEQLRDWVHTLDGWQSATLKPASADASFRRYFRASDANRTAIVMDAPPEKEDSAPFVEVTQRLLMANVSAPRIFAQNLQGGFLLLEDFGNTPLLGQLNATSADNYYQQAMQVLIRLQQANSNALPVYNAQLLQQEMALMPEWFLQKHLQLARHELPLAMISRTFDALTTAVLEQPTVFVHRDYHSRNLMMTTDGLGVIDHQDAVVGPVTYDLVSLLRDCYIGWPQQQVIEWVQAFQRQATAAGTIPPVDNAAFMRWFDLTGLQRHIKVLGVFCRLSHRDGKDNYLNDLPLTLSYVLTVGACYPETAALVEWMHRIGMPERMNTCRQ